MKNFPSGAEARRYLGGFRGTTEVVPFHDELKLAYKTWLDPLGVRVPFPLS